MTTTNALMAVAGAVAGVASGALGVGGGVIITPFLAFLTDLPQQSVLGTSLFATIPPSCVALMSHTQIKGNVDWRLSIGLALGCGLGSFAGSKMAVEMPSEVLEVLFACTML